MKAQRTKTQATGWENDVTKFKDVIALTVHLSDGKIPHHCCDYYWYGYDSYWRRDGQFTWVGSEPRKGLAVHFSVIFRP